MLKIFQNLKLFRKFPKIKLLKIFQKLKLFIFFKIKINWLNFPKILIV